MRIHTDYIAPADLTGYVRADLANRVENRFTLNRFLPNRAIDDLQYRFTRGGEGLTEAASFRSYDAESPTSSRPGKTRVSGELPPISRKLRLGEYDRLRQRHADDAIMNGLMDDASRLTRQIAARIELARGEALATGKVNLEENGLSAEVDFGRSSSHTATAGTPWTTLASADVLNDLVAWHDVYKVSNGEAPGAIVTSTKIARLMQRNAAVIAAITGAAAERTRVTMAELNALLVSEGLPSVEVNDAQVRVDGSAQRVVPENTVLLLPAPVDPFDFEGTDLGSVLWGTTAEALEPSYGIEDGEEPGIVAGVYSTEDPIALWTKAAAIALPVMANPDLSFAATVAG